MPLDPLKHCILYRHKGCTHVDGPLCDVATCPERIAQTQMTLEKAIYDQFRRWWVVGVFGKRRYGQAFYDHFMLYKLSNQDILGDLYQLDGDQAKAKIEELFIFS